MKKRLFLRFFIKNTSFFLQIPKKAVPLHPHSRKCTACLGYGVMVTLQILVLPFLVRVRVPQQHNRQVVQTTLGDCSFVGNFGFLRFPRRKPSVSPTAPIGFSHGTHWFPRRHPTVSLAAPIGPFGSIQTLKTTLS